MEYFNGLKFLGCGIIENSCSRVEKYFNYYGIQYNHSGNFQVKFNRRQEYTVNGSYAIITYPGPHFSYGSINAEPRHHSFVCFSGDRVQRFIEGGLLAIDPNQPLIKITRPDRFLETMRDIFGAIHGGAEQYDRAVCLLENLLLQLHGQSQPGSTMPGNQSQKLQGLLNDILTSPQLEWDFHREAAAMFLSDTHFRRLFKQFTSQPPQQFLIRCRLQLAMKMLIDTNEPVSEIANQCGFDDEFYFSRMFKKHYQMPPLTYRREFSG